MWKRQVVRRRLPRRGGRPFTGSPAVHGAGIVHRRNSLSSIVGLGKRRCRRFWSRPLGYSGRGKSIDRAIDKSIDMAAYGSVNKSTNELSVRDHASDDSDWAREGATPWGSGPAARRAVRRAQQGVAPSLACPRGAGVLSGGSGHECPRGATYAPRESVKRCRQPARQVARWAVGNGQGRGPFDAVLARCECSARAGGRTLDCPGIQSPTPLEPTPTASGRGRERPPIAGDLGSAAGAPYDLSRGSLPPSPDPWHWARSTGRVAPLGREQSKSGRKPRGLGPKAAGPG